MYKIMVYSEYEEVVEEVIDAIRSSRSERINIKKYNTPYLTLFGAIYNKGYDLAIFYVTKKIEINFARRFKFYHKDTNIIYLTNHEQLIPYMRQGEPFDCVVGKGEYERFNNVLENAFSRIESNRELFFEFKKGRQEYNVDLREVMYFYSDHRVVYIVHRFMGESFFYAKLDEVEPVVAGMTNIFIRVNKSYLVNRLCIHKIEDDKIIMKDGTVITTSKGYVRCSK